MPEGTLNSYNNNNYYYYSQSEFLRHKAGLDILRQRLSSLTALFIVLNT